jgi:hypothetical protein
VDAIMQDDAERDWQGWSREAVALMQERNRAFVETFELAGRPFQWSLDAAQIAFPAGDDAIVADLCVVGSVSEAEGTFLWAWGNDAVPAHARQRLGEVRAFGEAHDLPLLTTAEWPGGRDEGLEMLAVAGRVLDADGVFIAPDRGRLFFLALHRFRTQALSEVTWLTQPAGT